MAQPLHEEPVTSRLPRGRRALVIGLVAVTLSLGLTVYFLPTVQVSGHSMEATLTPGDRLLVTRHVMPDRDQLVAFWGSTNWGVEGQLYVKRVIGVPGDHVRCCTRDGRLERNGQPLDEPWTRGPASKTPFDVQVPDGRYWVMGDNRDLSGDSRSHLGAPGGGTIHRADIVGQVWLRYWPRSAVGTITR